VLATWATGTRGESGNWKGWDFLEKLGATRIGELANEVDARHLVLSGESPLSHSHVAGERLWMAKTSEPLLRLKGANNAGRFMNWARIADSERSEEGAVIYSETSDTSSRSAVFAFSESTWEARPFVTYLLIDDVLRWLTHEAVAVRAAWPNGRRAAQVIEMDTEDGFENAKHFAALMKENAQPATFYVLTSLAQNEKSVLTGLAQDFEIAYHGDVHDSFKGLAPNLQRQRLINMKSQLSRILPSATRITGFRAPTEGYDGATEIELHEAGFKHHAADPARSEGRLPVFAKIKEAEPENDLIVLPRTQRDDLNLSALNLDAQQTSQALIDDFNESTLTGALGWLSVHSQNFKPTGLLDQAFPSYLTHIRKSAKTVWFATAGQVSEWWRQRDRFKLESSFNGRRMDVNLTLKGSQKLDGPSIIIMLPKKGLIPIVQGTKVGTPVPEISAIDAFRAQLVFESLPPGNHSYQITFSAN
jgi:Polysaccharide deacetylase